LRQRFEVFYKRLDQEYPQYGKTMALPFLEKLEELAREIGQS
jgi:hypothetical protein